MVNLLVEKLVTHYILGRLINPITYVHALILGHRTEICAGIWGAAWVGMHYGALTPDQYAEVRNWCAGAGGVTMLDKFTRYSPLITGLIANAKALEEEKNNDADRGNP